MDFAEGSTAPENQTKPYFAADDQIQERTIFAILTLRCKVFILKKPVLKGFKTIIALAQSFWTFCFVIS